LRVASWLEQQGMMTGAPERMELRDGELVALLRFVEGRPLVEADSAAIGATLGHVHRLLAEAAVPPGTDMWPWAWLDPELIDEPALREAARTEIDRADGLQARLTRGILHGDPAPEAFLDTGDGIALIDWGAALHGPLLYDVASAWMYTRQDDRLLEAYAAAGPLSSEELGHAPAFLALRWAVQAWYFSWRLARVDLTGIDSQADNEKGLADARAFLLGRG
jgi:homoserine kinase type II